MGSQGKWLQLHKPTTRKPLWTRLASQHLCARPSWPGRFSWVLGRGEAEGMSSRCSARPTAAFPMASSVAQRHVGAGGPMPAGQWVVQSTPALCPFYTGPYCRFASESKEDYGERPTNLLATEYQRMLCTPRMAISVSQKYAKPEPGLRG